MNYRKIALSVPSLLLAIVTLTVCSAAALEKQTIDEKFTYLNDIYRLRAGAYRVNFNVQLQLNPAKGPLGTQIDFESDLGVPSSETRFLTQARYRMGTYSSIALTYYNTRRSTTKSLSRELHFGDRTFSANATVNAFFNTENLQIDYDYALTRNAHNEFGLSAGILTSFVSAGLSASGSVSGSTRTASGSNSKEADFIVPVPVVGIYLSSQFLPRTYFNNMIRFLTVDIAGYNVNVFNYMITLDYYPIQNLGLGAGYYLTNQEVNTGTNFEGKLISRTGGPILYATYYFY